MADAIEKSQGTVIRVGEAEVASHDNGMQPEAQRADRLRYVADMILELKQITERDGYRTLSGILALAHAEASTKRS